MEKKPRRQGKLQFWKQDVNAEGNQAKLPTTNKKYYTGFQLLVYRRDTENCEPWRSISMFT